MDPEQVVALVCALIGAFAAGMILTLAVLAKSMQYVARREAMRQCDNVAIVLGRKIETVNQKLDGYLYGDQVLADLLRADFTPPDGN